VRKMIHFSAVLLAVCGASGVGVGLTYVVALERIEANNRRLLEESLGAVFYADPLPELRWPGADQTSPLKKYPDGTDDLNKVWVARKDSEVTGFAAIGTKQGYSSALRVLVAVAAPGGVLPAKKEDCRVVGVKVLFQQETPGLGARVDEVKATETLWGALGRVASGREKPAPESAEARREADTPWFQYEFVGKRYDQLTITRTREDSDKAILAISASTITSTAVVDAVRAAVDKLYDELGGGGAGSNRAGANP
jgi:electron transport complex protein RnfG